MPRSGADRVGLAKARGTHPNSPSCDGAYQAFGGLVFNDIIRFGQRQMLFPNAALEKRFEEFEPLNLCNVELPELDRRRCRARSVCGRGSAAVPACVVGIALLGGSLPAYARDNRHAVSVGGEVNLRTTYTLQQLAALPQTSVTLTRGGRQVTATGVLLETLVSSAKPAFPASLVNTKNELLRVTASVRGRGHEQVTFAVGELDPPSVTIQPYWH